MPKLTFGCLLALALALHGSGLHAQNPALDLSRPRSTTHAPRLTNLSIRAAVSADNPLIAGAAVRGASGLPFLVRGVGPGLERFGVANALRAPQLEVYQNSQLSARASGMGDNVPAVSAYVGAFPAVMASAGGDAGMVGTALPGTLTAHCVTTSTAGSVALLELYDAVSAPTENSPRFVNFSSRTRVEAGEGLVIVGFTVAGQGELRLLLRGVGPSLAAFNVPGVLADPQIELYAGSTRLAANDDWRSAGTDAVAALEAAGRAAGAFDLASSGDAAMIVALRAGSYTLHLRGAAGQTGAALAEVYELPAGEGFNAAEATNAVGLDLFRELAKARADQNLVVSPYSIESALALAYAGAEGGTRSEMARALRLPADNATLQAGMAELREALARLAADSKRLADSRTAAGTRTDPIEWNAANRLFGQNGYGFRESFLTLMRDGFAAPLEAMEFNTSPEPSRLAINAWVEDQTRQKIRDLLPSGSIDRLTRLVLVNALYLKAPWATPFPKLATAPRAFRTPAGSSEVATMQRTGFMGHASEDGTTIVTLDYLGGGLQFVIILPAEGEVVDAVAARLGPAHFARWARLSDTSARFVALHLPKFKVEGASVPLSGALQSLGMLAAFDIPSGSANFDGIAPRRASDYLSITNVFHKTFVALDEEGTEAAAATGVVFGTTSLPPSPIEVRVDRPFLFAIQHRATALCLFLGRITDPR